MDVNFPDELEVAPKGDAHCKGCYQKIYKGDIRLRERRYDPKYHYVNTYMCHKCIKKYAKRREDEARDIFLKLAGIPVLLDELMKKHKKQLKANDSLRRKEMLVKQIEENNKREAWNNKYRNLSQ